MYKLNKTSMRFQMNFEKKSYDIPKQISTQYIPDTSLTTNIIIYILCYNASTYDFSKQYYSKYKWARPILMKYQDYTFENAFWKQLLEISDEWENCDMVGTISYKAYKKINLENMNNIIMNKLYLSKQFFAFNQSTNTLFNDKSDYSYKTKILIKYMSDSLNNHINYKLSYCNYFMTTPELMKQFINWHIHICLPILLKNPLSYHKFIYNGNLTEIDLIKIWGKPYYPHIPFILERINLLFFKNYL
jgi:hypothetical protein